MSSMRIVGDDLARFEDSYIPEPNSGCWLWLKTPDKGGYGVFRVRRKNLKAHRYSYELYLGKFLKDWYLIIYVVLDVV